jgi:hypothetical protein
VIRAYYAIVTRRGEGATAVSRAGGMMAKLVPIAVALVCWSAVAAAAESKDPICADRPGKANPTCTVPPGMVQVETGLVDWSGDNSGGVRTDEFDIGATAVKVGLTDRLHIELDLPAYVDVHSRAGGIGASTSGFGDSGVALKYRVTPTSAPVQVALYPFIKIPTARRSLGNGKVEGGLAILADGAFGGSPIAWDVAPELDLVADSDGAGYHLAMVQVVSLGVPVSSRLSISGDLWGSWDFDPAGPVRQYSADAATAYVLTDNVQLDAGANFGLNRNTPDIEVYSGISFRL